MSVTDFFVLACGILALLVGYELLRDIFCGPDR